MFIGTNTTRRKTMISKNKTRVVMTVLTAAFILAISLAAFLPVGTVAAAAENKGGPGGGGGYGGRERRCADRGEGAGLGRLGRDRHQGARSARSGRNPRPWCLVGRDRQDGSRCVDLGEMHITVANSGVRRQRTTLGSISSEHPQEGLLSLIHISEPTRPY